MTLRDFLPLGVPVKYAGVGEGIDDLRPFDALEFAQALLKPFEPHHLKALPKGTRDACIRTLKSEGFSIKQIVRLTGIGHCTIQKVKV